MPVRFFPATKRFSNLRNVAGPQGGPPGVTGWQSMIDTTVGAQPLQAGYHGFVWDGSLLNTVGYLSTGEGDLSNIRFVIGGSGQAIVTQKTANPWDYNYVHDIDVDLAGTVVVGIAQGGHANAMDPTTLASKPNWPIFLPGSYDYGNGVEIRRCFTDGTYAFFADVNTSGAVAGVFRVVSIATGTVVATLTDPGGNPWFAVYQMWHDKDNKRIYMVPDTSTGRCLVIDVTNPLSPSFLHVFPSGLFYICATTATRLYAVGAGGLTINVYDTTTWASPTIVGSYTVPTDGHPGDHHLSSQKAYICVGCNRARTRLIAPWGGGDYAAFDILNITTDTPALVAQPSCASTTDYTGELSRLAVTSQSVRFSPDDSKILLSMGTGGVPGQWGSAIHRVDDDSGTVLQIIPAAAETKIAAIDPAGVIIAGQQYTNSIFDNTGKLQWSLPVSWGNSGDNMFPYKDANTWFFPGRTIGPDAVIQTSGTGAPTVVSVGQPSGSGSGSGSIWDGTFLYTLSLIGGTGTLSIWQVGTLAGHYTCSLVDSIAVGPTGGYVFDGASNAIYVDGTAGTAGARVLTQDQGQGIRYFDTSNVNPVLGPGRITEIVRGGSFPNATLPNPLIYSSMLLRYYAHVDMATGGSVTMGTAGDYYSVYPVFFDGSSNPLGQVTASKPGYTLTDGTAGPNSKIYYLDLTGGTSSASPQGGLLPGGNALNVTLPFIPAGAASVRLYAARNVQVVPGYTGATLSGAGLVNGAVLTITSAPSSWTTPIPTQKGQPALGGANTGGSAESGSSRDLYQATLIYYDPFGTPVGFSGYSVQLDWRSASGFDTLRVTIPTGSPGDGVIPLAAAQTGVWVGYDVFSNNQIVMSKLTLVSGFATNHVDITTSPGTWGDASRFPQVPFYDPAFQGTQAFSAAHGSSSIHKANGRYYHNLGDSGVLIMNATTLQQTGQIPGLTNLNSNRLSAPHGCMVLGQYLCFSFYSAGAGSGEGNCFVFDTLNTPDSPTQVAFLPSSQAFGCWSPDEVKAGVSWFTPWMAGLLVIGSLPGPVVFRKI